MSRPTVPEAAPGSGHEALRCRSCLWSGQGCRNRRAPRPCPSAVRPPAGHLCGAVRQLRTPVTCPAPSSSQVSTPPVRAPLASLRDLRPLTRSAPTYIWLVARTTGKCGLAHVRRPAWQASPISCPVAARYTCSSQARAAASSPSIHGTPSRRHQSALKIALCA
jgi:hypothetical protein